MSETEQWEWQCIEANYEGYYWWKRRNKGRWISADVEEVETRLNALEARTEAAEAALARARDALERVKWQEDLDETCCPTGSYHCIGCYAWRGKKGQPEVHDPKCFVAAALEATQLRATQRETDAETAPD